MNSAREMDRRPCFMETGTLGGSHELAVAGSLKTPHVQQDTTLDYNRGQAFQKLVPTQDDIDVNMYTFFLSGKAG
jgi:hypothetical protein